MRLRKTFRARSFFIVFQLYEASVNLQLWGLVCVHGGRESYGLGTIDLALELTGPDVLVLHPCQVVGSARCTLCRPPSSH